MSEKEKRKPQTPFWIFAMEKMKDMQLEEKNEGVQSDEGAVGGAVERKKIDIQNVVSLAGADWEVN